MKILIMKTIKTILLCLILLIISSCNQISNHKHDGSYSLNIQVFGANVNSKTHLIISGDKIKFTGKILDCKQYNDRIDIENGKVIFTVVDGNLITNVPTLGKLRYVRISGDTNMNQE